MNIISSVVNTEGKVQCQHSYLNSTRVCQRKNRLCNVILLTRRVGSGPTHRHLQDVPSMWEYYPKVPWPHWPATHDTHPSSSIDPYYHPQTAQDMTMGPEQLAHSLVHGFAITSLPGQRSRATHSRTRPESSHLTRSKAQDHMDEDEM